MKQGGGTWHGGERGKRIWWREGLGTVLRRRGELAAARARACGCGGVEQGRRGGVRGWRLGRAVVAQRLARAALAMSAARETLRRGGGDYGD